MIYLSKQQKLDMGLSFILNQLNTCTPYGSDLAAKLKPFTPGKKDLLTEELDNLGLILGAYNKLSGVINILPQFKDIRPQVKKCSGKDYVLNEVELFELKIFLLSLEKLDEELSKLELGLTFTLPQAMPQALSLLDPEGGKLRTFYIADSATHKLSEIRAEKRRLEAAIIASENEESKRLLRDKRLLTVCAEEDEELLIRRKLTTGIYSYSSDFLANASAIGKLDLLIQKGSLALKYKTSRPVISDDGLNPEIVFEDVYNPYVAWHLEKSGKEFTPVSIKLRRGAAILTGANMGGKSVALKTFTLNIMLFQMGFYVFAEKAVLPLFDNVHLICEDLQSMHKGLSSFAAEIVKLNEITKDLEHLERGFSFVALDEFARGTNPQEGAALARAVAQYLDGKKNSISILTTHYDNVCSKEFNNYQVIGLKNLDIEKFRQKLLPDGENSAALIAEYMDYRLKESDEDPPKDAVNICKLLNLSTHILDLL